MARKRWVVEGREAESNGSFPWQVLDVERGIVFALFYDWHDARAYCAAKNAEEAKRGRRKA